LTAISTYVLPTTMILGACAAIVASEKSFFKKQYIYPCVKCKKIFDIKFN
jgi:hypothetical protein